MASINFKKVKSKSTVAALMRHNDSEERLKHEHANEHIDKDKTGENIQFWNYRTCAARFSDRIKELDATTNTNHRKDRVEAVAIEIPMPAEGMTRDEEIRVAKTYSDFLINTYGKENICGFWYHRDEVHEYHDAADGKDHISRGHIHAIVVPVVDGKLNCKIFTNKSSMREANKRLDALVRKEHGMPFLTGETPKRQTVEQLKAAEKNFSLDKEITERKARIAEGQKTIDKLDREVKAQGEEIQKLSSRYEGNMATLDALRDDLSEAAELIARGREYLQHIEEAEAGTYGGEVLVDECQYRTAEQLQYVDRDYDSPQEDIDFFLGFEPGD